MADNSDSTLNLDIPVDKVLGLIATIFSTIVLTAVGVIVSGKLLSSRLSIGGSKEDIFVVNLAILQIRSRDDEVIWGFTIFILVLGTVIFFGGGSAYHFFRDNSGIDVGHWNSLCAISSFGAILTSLALWVVVPLSRDGSIVSVIERKKQINKIKKMEIDKDKFESTANLEGTEPK